MIVALVFLKQNWFSNFTKLVERWGVLLVLTNDCFGARWKGNVNTEFPAQYIQSKFPFGSESQFFFFLLYPTLFYIYLLSIHYVFHLFLHIIFSIANSERTSLTSLGSRCGSLAMEGLCEWEGLAEQLQVFPGLRSLGICPVPLNIPGGRGAFKRLWSEPWASRACGFAPTGSPLSLPLPGQAFATWLLCCLLSLAFPGTILFVLWEFIAEQQRYPLQQQLQVTLQLTIWAGSLGVPLRHNIQPLYVLQDKQVQLWLVFG